MASRTISLQRRGDDRVHHVEVQDDSGTLMARTGGREFRVTHQLDGELRIDGGRAVPAWALEVDGTRWVFVDGEIFEFSDVRPRTRTSGAPQHASLTAPMPATVRRVMVATGDVVSKGATLIVLEAMKMELPVRSTSAGVVRAVHCREGELVQPGVPLLELDESK